jgi:2-polyprenyl-3-methyl-5-hydroxy-6-metoxy-1,4-benzoquinol methylase
MVDRAIVLEFSCMSLAARVVVPELMDAPGLDPVAHTRALVGLSRLNALAASRRLVWTPVEAFARAHGRSLDVVDVACGGGDTAIDLAARARAAGLELQVRGVDVSPTALEHARHAAVDAGVDVAFERTNVLDVHDLPLRADVLTCTLFLHHTSRPQALSLLRAMANAARLGIVVVDLLRTRLGFALATLAARLVTRSPIVHFDAAASVRAAFSFDEVRALAQEAGLVPMTLERVWPERFRLVWSRR